MEIQKIFSDQYGDERLYSVLMDEYELQRAFGVATALVGKGRNIASLMAKKGGNIINPGVMNNANRGISGFAGADRIIKNPLSRTGYASGKSMITPGLGKVGSSPVNAALGNTRNIASTDRITRNPLYKQGINNKNI